MMIDDITIDKGKGTKTVCNMVRYSRLVTKYYDSIRAFNSKNEFSRVSTELAYIRSTQTYSMSCPV
jgi:hypothetical protein